MPTFHPSLAQTSFVHVPPTDTPSYAHLDFVAEFAQDEDTSGTWQIWTDLPQLGPSGEKILPDGEWRAIDFDSPAAGVSPLKLHARVTLFAHYPSTYSFTFRRAFPSGDIHWLGSGGSNGEIKLEEGEESTVITARSGRWTEESVTGLDKLSWSGIAFVNASKDGLASLEIKFLPQEHSISAKIVIARGTPEVPKPSFAFVTSTLESTPAPSPDSNLLILTEQNVAIKTQQILPGFEQEAYFALNTTTVSEIAQAVQQAIPHSNLQVIPTGANSIAFYLPFEDSELEGGSICFYTSKGGSGSVSLPLSKLQLSADSPVIILDNNAKVIHSSKDLTGEFALPITFLTSDSQAGVATLLHFTQIRGSDDTPCWIVAPKACQIEIGEEEIQELQSGAEIFSQAPVEETIVDETSEQEVAEEETLRENQTGEIGAESVQPIEAAKDETPSPWVIFKMLGRFLVGIWHFILDSFSKPALTAEDKQDTITEYAATEFSGENDTEMPVTPADERTPLLGSPTIARTVSSSGLSPSATMTNIPNLKTREDLEAVNKQLSSTQTSVTPVSKVQIRSYTEFKFAQQPPFAFYLLPGYHHTLDTLSFRIKEETSGEWCKVVPEVKETENECPGFTIGDATAATGSRWQVQVDRA